VTITFQDDELHQLLKEHVRSTQPELLANSHDQTLTYPDWLGLGYKRDIDLPSGIYMTLHRYYLHQDLVQVCSAQQNDCFEFVFGLTAQSQCNEGSVFGDRQAYLIGPRHSDQRWHEFAGQDYQSVDIHLNPALLAALTDSHRATRPPALTQMLAGRNEPGEGNPLCLNPVPITPAMQTTLWQILQCPYQGLTRTLFLEAKSLELMALFFQAWEEDGATKQGLNQYDLECVYHARYILQNNLQNPPTLMDLARQVGLNERKLREGFRQVFDTTVFGYLTQQRMATACQLLVQQRSVAVVAAAVGYASPTAFSGAFQRQFGVAPKAYQLEHRQRA
jgi:AraC-like DNA-binding protein